MSLFLFSDSVAVPSYVQQEIREIPRLPLSDSQEDTQRKIKVIFARIPNRFQARAEEELQKSFPTIFANMTRKAPNKGIMSGAFGVFNYFFGTAPPIPQVL